MNLWTDTHPELSVRDLHRKLDQMEREHRLPYFTCKHGEADSEAVAMSRSIMAKHRAAGRIR